MNILILLLFYISTIYAGDNSDISFRYGLLSIPSYKLDSIIVLTDSSIIHSGDFIRINIGYQNKTNFYIIYKDAEDNYMQLFSQDKKNESNLDTLYYTALHWAEMLDPTGLETFYFINSRAELTELRKLIIRYEKAPEKAKLKLSNRIQIQIDKLDPNIKGNIALLSSRLDKPMVGGVAFRGDDTAALKDMSITHVCNGSNGVAFQKIVLNHR